MARVARMWRLAVLATAALAVAALAGCGSEATTEAVAAGWPGVHDAPPPEVAGEPNAASGPDLGLLGQGSLEGRDVVIWFWAEW